MRELWPFSRKLALVMAGGRASALLKESYQPLFATEEEGLAVTWTKTDVELAAELGARLLDLCGIGPGCQLTCLLPSEPSFDNLMLTHGATRAQVTITEDSPVVAAAAEDGATLLETRDMDLLLVFGLPSAALRDAAASRGTQLATVWTCGPARMAAIEAPEDEGLRLFPDLVAAEILDPETAEPAADDSAGELVLTNVCSHGTALLRYRTGLQGRLDWTPRPPFGTLPRLIFCS